MASFTLALKSWVNDTFAKLADLGTAATTAATDYASAAQGGKADSAVQPAVLSSAISALGLKSASTHEASDFATSTQGGKADSAVQPGSLAQVATTGAYGDLTGKPTLGSAASHSATDFDAAGAASSAVSAHAGGTGVHSIAGVTGLQAALNGKQAADLYVIVRDHSGQPVTGKLVTLTLTADGTGIDDITVSNV